MEPSEAKDAGLIRRGWKAWLLVVALGLSGVIWASFQVRVLRRNGVLARLSYDGSHRWHRSRQFTNVVLVEIDGEALKRFGNPIPRTNFVRLLDLPPVAAARLVFFDLVFDTHREPGVDDALADRLTRRPEVVIGGALHRKPTEAGAVFDASSGAPGVQQVQATPPLEPFTRTDPPNWGLLDFDTDPDNVVRRLYGHYGLLRDSRHPDFFTAGWRAARVLTNAIRGEWEERWLRYYGPAGHVFRHVGLAEALDDPDRLRHAELIFVGVNDRGLAGVQGGQRNDRFPGPFAGDLYTGLELQATATVNLWRGEALSRRSPAWQLGVVLAWGTLLTRLLLLRKSLAMQACLVGSAVLLGCLEMDLALRGGVQAWWPWLVPVGLQTAAALIATAWMPEPPLGPDRVFLSYCAVGSGEIHARALEQGLRSRRIPAFLAPGLIPGGASYEEELFGVIVRTPNYLLVLTPTARDELKRPSSWVAREFRHAVETGRRILIVRTRAGSTTFDRDDLKEPEAFLRRLRDGGDPPTQWLRGCLPADLRERIASDDASDTDTTRSETVARVMEVLGEVLQRGSIYDPARFAGVTLSARSRDLLAAGPAGDGAARLNRSLLQDLYPLEWYQPDEFVAPIDLVAYLPPENPRREVHQVTFDPGQGFREAMRQIVAGLR